MALCQFGVATCAIYMFAKLCSNLLSTDCYLINLLVLLIIEIDDRADSIFCLSFFLSMDSVYKII